MILDKFKDVSIRGRYAFGMCCLERCVEKDKITSQLLAELIDKMWEFTYAEDLNDWFFSVNEWRPECILDEHPDVLHRLKTLTPNKAMELKNLYQNLPSHIVRIIENIFFIGIAELYTSIKGYSSDTLEYLNLIISVTESQDVTLPNSNSFLQFSFADNHGWGLKMHRNEINNLI